MGHFKLDPLQFAYRNNKSVYDAVSLALHTTLEHLDKRNTYARMLSIDFSSAFNTIVKGRLVVKQHDETTYRSEVAELVEWCYNDNLTLNIRKIKEIIVEEARRMSHTHHHSRGSSQNCQHLQITERLSWSENTAAILTEAHQQLRSTAVSVILYVSMFAVVILTLCGNLIVIISITHFKQLHTPTNMLVLSLAVADLLVGVFVMPFDMVKLIESCWYFGSFICSFRTAFSFCLTSVSISSLIFIAIDRYFAVFNPFLYSTKITLNIALFCIVLSWLSSLCYNLSLFFFNGNNDSEKLNACFGDCFILINATWGIIDLLVTFIIPCCVMIILYARIFLVAKKQAQAINSITNQITFTNGINRISKKSEWKAAKTLGIVFQKEYRKEKFKESTNNL
nr:PREDICTED: trace amine-associated receptor 13c-like [Lepisosteus oculatus]